MNDRITGSHDQITAGNPDPGAAPPSQGITDAPPPAPPAEAPPSSRGRVQWIVVLGLLAALVFGAVFAMNYLPYLTQGQGAPKDDPDLQRTLSFVNTVGPITDSELGRREWYDFWFVNDNKKAIVMGLREKQCTCSSVEGFLLTDRHLAARQTLEVTSAAGTGSGGLLAALCALRSAGFYAWPDVEGHEMLLKSDTMEVPAGAVGWVRLFWKGERPGPQTLKAAVWMNDLERGPGVRLGLPVFHREAIRARTTLAFGTLNEEDLKKPEGVTKWLYVWSSTRRKFRLNAKSTTTGPGAELFEVGTPVALTPDELLELQRKNNPHPSGPAPDEPGWVLAGYKVPVTVYGQSRDEKVHFDVGAFRRSILLSSPDVDGDPKRVVVRGRALGLVDMAGDSEGGETIDFGSFPRRVGTDATPALLTSRVPGLTLTLDRERTAAWLDAKLDEVKDELGDGRRGWKLKASVLPEKVSGSFPRAEDPLYEDSAVYLIAKVPNKPPRPIRIAVRGMANES